MTTISDLLDEFARALRFPDYFGHNFNALKDCLTDLQWLPAGAHVLLLTDGLAVLSRESDEDFHAFVRILQMSAAAWEEGVLISAARRAIPFQVVFQEAPENSAQLRHRLEAAGVATSPDSG